MRISMDDWQLLQAYAKNRSEAAFAELVRLHLDWVYSVALRHVGDPHPAEDARRRWHAEFERRAPEGHQEFLLSLGIPADEVERGRRWSRGEIDDY